MFKVSALPTSMQQMPRWETAAQALMLVVDTGGPIMLARIAMVRAFKIVR